ncbi:MAG: hypothetical protein WAV98_00675 [Minisyncoccia bacterium]
MEQKKAKAQLEKFLKGRTLTFSTTHYPSGEWVAQCNEIPGIVTGGMDLGMKDTLMRDAILAAAGVNAKYANTLLKNVGYVVSSSNTKVRARKSNNKTQELTVC